jgi:hypothetical protein
MCIHADYGENRSVFRLVILLGFVVVGLLVAIMLFVNWVVCMSCWVGNYRMIDFLFGSEEFRDRLGGEGGDWWGNVKRKIGVKRSFWSEIVLWGLCEGEGREGVKKTI